MMAGACALVSATTCGQTLRVRPSALVEEVLTNNVNLGSSANAKGDLVTELIPGLRIEERSAHTSLTGIVEAPILLYARTGSENNRIFPQASLVGSFEAVPKFFFLEGAASVQQSFFSPFGAQPTSLVNATETRFRTDSYRVTPHIKGPTAGDIRYDLRDDNIWTHLSGAPAGVGDSFTNRLSGQISRIPRPLGWGIEVQRTSEKFTGQPALVTQLARARVPFRVDPELQAWASSGYEDNRYTLTHPHGTIYGAGFEWRYSPRTTAKAEWEHRFFGSSYSLTADERTALSTWSVRVSRNITTSAEEVARLGAGVDVQSILNQILLSPIPHPAQRQLAIDELIQS